MKKSIFIVLIVLISLLFSVNSFADVTITVNWTKSVSDNAVQQKVIFDGVEKLTIPIDDPSSCTFIETGVNVIDLIGKQVIVRTISDQGVYADLIGSVGAVEPATGMNILVTDID